MGGLRLAAPLHLAATVLAVPTHAQDVTYAEIAPILTARCAMCHSGPDAALGLRLDSLDYLLKGGRKGPVGKLGDPAGSELSRRIKGTSKLRMPMTGPPFLSDVEISLFERWGATGLRPGKGTKTATGVTTPTALPKAGETVTCARVAPVFARRCAKCHTENGAMGPAPEGYRLTSFEATLATADRARVVPGNPSAGKLARRIRGQARPRMPFDGPPYLSDAR